MKTWTQYLFLILAIGSLLYSIYDGFQNNFENGYYTIISFSLFSILAISKFTKHPL